MSDPLFDDPGAARHDDPETSHRAAKARRPNLRRAIVDAFLHAGPRGLTDDELVERILEKHSTAHVPSIKTARSALTGTGKPLRRVPNATDKSNTGSAMRVHVHGRHLAAYLKEHTA